MCLAPIITLVAHGQIMAIVTHPAQVALVGPVPSITCQRIEPHHFQT